MLISAHITVLSFCLSPCLSSNHSLALCFYFCPYQSVCCSLRLCAWFCPNPSLSLDSPYLFSVTVTFSFYNFFSSSPIFFSFTSSNFILFSSSFGKNFNEELKFRHFTSNIIRVSIYMKIFGLNNLHDYKNRDEKKRA